MPKDTSTIGATKVVIQHLYKFRQILSEDRFPLIETRLPFNYRLQNYTKIASCASLRATTSPFLAFS